MSGNNNTKFEALGADIKLEAVKKDFQLSTGRAKETPLLEDPIGMLIAGIAIGSVITTIGTVSILTDFSKIPEARAVKSDAVNGSSSDKPSPLKTSAAHSPQPN